VPHSRHELLCARASSRCKCVPGVTKVVEPEPLESRLCTRGQPHSSVEVAPTEWSPFGAVEHQSVRINALEITALNSTQVVEVGPRSVWLVASRVHDDHDDHDAVHAPGTALALSDYVVARSAGGKQSVG
jgi:hypothetical protein